jgi:hypothetical protein
MTTQTHAASEHLSTRPRRHPQMPLLLCGLVMAIAMLSFYVVLINEQIQRGELLRQSFIAAPASPGAISAAAAGHAQAMQPSAPVGAGTSTGR